MTEIIRDIVTFITVFLFLAGVALFGSFFGYRKRAEEEMTDYYEAQQRQYNEGHRNGFDESRKKTVDHLVELGYISRKQAQKLYRKWDELE